jgi:hypothetical protein
MSRDTRTLKKFDIQCATLVHRWKHHLEAQLLFGTARWSGHGRTVGSVRSQRQCSAGADDVMASFEEA